MMQSCHIGRSADSPVQPIKPTHNVPYNHPLKELHIFISGVNVDGSSFGCTRQESSAERSLDFLQILQQTFDQDHSVGVLALDIF